MLSITQNRGGDACSKKNYSKSFFLSLAEANFFEGVPASSEYNLQSCLFCSIWLLVLASVNHAAPLGLYDIRLILIEFGAWDGNLVLPSASVLRKNIRILHRPSSSSPLEGERNLLKQS